MEYLELGNLSTYLDRKPPVPPLPELEGKEISYQILDGLNMMYENGVSHRVLKPNVSRLPEYWKYGSLKWLRCLEYPYQIMPRGGLSSQTLVLLNASKELMGNRQLRAL